MVRSYVEGHPPEIDHQELLAKYIQHVENEEGTTFIGESYRDGLTRPGGPTFADSEWTELERLEVDALNRLNIDRVGAE